jgi:hypothetical protein
MLFCCTIYTWILRERSYRYPYIRLNMYIYFIFEESFSGLWWTFITSLSRFYWSLSRPR